MFVDPAVATAARINTTAQRFNFSPQDTAFYCAQLLVDSDNLLFKVEPWAPGVIVHQQLYSSAVFGNSTPQDAQRYRSRGYGRVVGRKNYCAYSEWSGADCETRPELLEEQEHQYLSWEWLWRRRSGTACARVALRDFGYATLLFVGWRDRVDLRLRTYNRNLEQINGRHPSI